MTSEGNLYGQSLYTLAVEENLADALMEEMTAVRNLLEQNPEYVTLLSEPSIPKKTRLGLLDDAFRGQIQPYLLNFLKILVEHGSLRTFSECCRVFREAYNRDHGIVEAVVYSAVALKGEQIQLLQSKLEKISGKKVILVQKIDKNVLAGLRVEMEGKLLDGTVMGRLADLRKKIGEVVM